MSINGGSSVLAEDSHPIKPYHDIMRQQEGGVEHAPGISGRFHTPEGSSNIYSTKNSSSEVELNYDKNKGKVISHSIRPHSSNAEYYTSKSTPSKFKKHLEKAANYKGEE